MNYNGYAELHDVGIKVRADNLEIAAGWADEKAVDYELSFALGALDWEDADTMRWLAVVLAAKIDHLDAQNA